MRISGWQEALDGVLQECSTTPFAYGSHDCCLFAAKCVDAMTGSSFYAELQTKYTDEASAMAYLADAGGLEAAVSEWLGPSTAPNWAGPGDVVLCSVDGVPTLGVCLGINNAHAGSPFGIKYRPRSSITACWRIE